MHETQLEFARVAFDHGSMETTTPRTRWWLRWSACARSPLGRARVTLSLPVCRHVCARAVEASRARGVIIWSPGYALIVTIRWDGGTRQAQMIHGSTPGRQICVRTEGADKVRTASTHTRRGAGGTGSDGSSLYDEFSTMAVFLTSVIALRYQSSRCRAHLFGGPMSPTRWQPSFQRGAAAFQP